MNNLLYLNLNDNIDCLVNMLTGALSNTGFCFHLLPMTDGQNKLNYGTLKKREVRGPDSGLRSIGASEQPSKRGSVSLLSVVPQSLCE